MQSINEASYKPTIETKEAQATDYTTEQKQVLGGLIWSRTFACIGPLSIQCHLTTGCGMWMEGSFMLIMPYHGRRLVKNMQTQFLGEMW